MALVPTFIDGILKLHTNVGYDNISSKDQCPGRKVKVTVAIFRKTLSSL